MELHLVRFWLHYQAQQWIHLHRFKSLPVRARDCRVILLREMKLHSYNPDHDDRPPTRHGITVRWHGRRWLELAPFWLTCASALASIHVSTGTWGRTILFFSWLPGQAEPEHHRLWALFLWGPYRILIMWHTVAWPSTAVYSLPLELQRTGSSLTWQVVYLVRLEFALAWNRLLSSKGQCASPCQHPLVAPGIIGCHKNTFEIHDHWKCS